MTDNIVAVDFGKEYNDTTRRFARLVDTAEKQREEMAKDPAKFISEAHDRVVDLMRKMDRARNATRSTTVPFETRFTNDAASAMMETVRIPKDDYDRLKRIEAAVRSWDTPTT